MAPISRLLGRLTMAVQSRSMSAQSATFQVKPYKLHRMEQGPSTTVEVTREEALEYYKEMTMVRRLEASAGNLYKEKQIRGFCHLYTGQEAVCVGMEAAINKNDAVITSYRAHGWTYVRGVPLNKVLSELTGRSTGCSKGKGGSMHVYDEHFYGGNGIVGAQMPLGAGIALGQKYAGTKEITAALCGDGALNQGQVFEALNMSALWQLPCLFVVENNGWGMGTAVSRASASTEFYTRGDFVPGIWVDGMDVLAVKQATKFLADQCREGKGPFVVEMATYRYVGHSVSDPGTSYRTREEVQEIRQKRDPISHLKEKILDSELATAEELKAIDADVKKQVDEATKLARTDPELPIEDLYNDVYYNNVEPTTRGITPFTTHVHKRTAAKVWNMN